MFSLFMSQNQTRDKISGEYGIKTIFHGFAPNSVSADIKWYTNSLENPYHILSNEYINNSTIVIKIPQTTFLDLKTHDTSFIDLEFSEPVSITLRYGQANIDYVEDYKEIELNDSTHYKVETGPISLEECTSMKIEIFKR